MLVDWGNQHQHWSICIVRLVLEREWDKHKSVTQTFTRCDKFDLLLYSLKFKLGVN